MTCPFCHKDHEHCDSPGAILTRTTGCPVVDGEPQPKSEKELQLDELRARVSEELKGNIW